MFQSIHCRIGARALALCVVLIPSLAAADVGITQIHTPARRQAATAGQVVTITVQVSNDGPKPVKVAVGSLMARNKVARSEGKRIGPKSQGLLELRVPIEARKVRGNIFKTRILLLKPNVPASATIGQQLWQDKNAANNGRDWQTQVKPGPLDITFRLKRFTRHCGRMKKAKLTFEVKAFGSGDCGRLVSGPTEWPPKRDDTADIRDGDNPVNVPHWKLRGVDPSCIITHRTRLFFREHNRSVGPLKGYVFTGHQATLNLHAKDARGRTTVRAPEKRNQKCEQRAFEVELEITSGPSGGDLR